MNAPLRVGIVPAHQHCARARLWAALEAAYPVRFAGRGPDDVGGLDAVVALTSAAPSMGLPCLLADGEEAPRGAPRAVALAEDAALAHPLRGACLSDAHAVVLPAANPAQGVPLPTANPGERVLATLDGTPAWTCGAGSGAPRHRVASLPAELTREEALRERLRPGRCLALLALAHFLAELTAEMRPERPPLQAAFVIDDPNLRLPRYGHIDYAQLLRGARRDGYHVSIAMVPLDGRLAHRRAVDLFRAGPDHLSLCIHGNDHDGPELGRPRSQAEALAVVAQALRRTAAFEARTGIAVDRVMAPPHERLSEPMARALHAGGFRAVTTTRPYPWVANTLDRSWLARPADAGPLAAWGPVDAIAGGLPVLLRADFEHPREDLVLRAFLGQPLILYGHHDLLAGGAGALAEAAAEIERLGEVRWSPLAEIARTYASADLTAGACADLTAGASADLAAGAVPDPSAAPKPNAPVSWPLDPATLAAIPRPRRRLAPVLRRLASEGRDRALPLRRGRGRGDTPGERSRSWSGRR